MKSSPPPPPQLDQVMEPNHRQGRLGNTIFFCGQQRIPVIISDPLPGKKRRVNATVVPVIITFPKMPELSKESCGFRNDGYDTSIAHGEHPEWEDAWRVQ